VRYRLLGPLVLEHDGGELAAVAGPRLRVLLAALLLHANEPVSGDALADVVWDGSPPAGAAVTLRGHVLRLRRLLGTDAAARIETRDPGYLIQVRATELDVLEFEALGQDAGALLRAAAWAEASAAASRALGLWRATPLLDVPSQRLRDEFVPALEQRRLQALENRIEAELHLGHFEGLIPELLELSSAHPFRERLHAQLMLALALAGRRAEALAAYLDARQVLVEGLGIEPGAELRALHQRILADDSTLTAVPRDQAPTVLVPRQLPATVAHFAGRESELKSLSELLDQVGRGAGAIAASVISGTAGIGKTALALHWSQQVADQFPDGQLYLNLRGFDPSDAPVAVATAVRGFLDALEVTPARIPGGVDAQLALYRSMMADRRMLVLLDNARDESQVRPLLPGFGGCLTLITSRSQLAGLVALDGAVPLTLDLLSFGEARDLLARRLGQDRVAGEEQAVGQLIEAGARLPLALNLVAARAALHPGTRLIELARQLDDSHRRLDLLSARESAADMRAVFSWSLRTVSDQAARMFRLLGLHPGPDIGVSAAASLAGADHVTARRALDELTAAHLLTEHSAGRYAFHDLLRVYAAEQASVREAEVSRREALRRVLDHYLHTVWHATVLAYTPWSPPHLARPAPGASPEIFTERQQVIAWFEAERQVLLAVATKAYQAGFDTHTWQIAWGTGLFLIRMGYQSEWGTLCGIALAAAEHGNDLAGQCYAHRWLGEILSARGDYGEGHEHLRQALAASEVLGDLSWRGNIHLAIGRALDMQGRYAEAIDHARRAVDLCSDGTHPARQAQALNAVGWYHARLGQHERALEFCQQALDLAREAEDQRSESAILDSLGLSYHHLGRHTTAIDHYQNSVRLRRSLGDRSNLAGTLIRLGDAHRAGGHPDDAREAFQQALEIAETLSPPDAEAVRAKLRALSR
jgi:DNA-binding SARP family transcriptional activator